MRIYRKPRHPGYYPNPFNPDTWIPYCLSRSSHVSISIYNASGQLVRKLNLGIKEAGSYTDKSQAVYWDGKNDKGEKLASGPYFCIMQGDNFTAIRKMLMIE